MNTPHTPGPWGFHPAFNEDKPMLVIDDLSKPPRVAFSRRISLGEKLIAEVTMGTGFAGFPRVDNLGEMDANARLVAAAPELLACLEGALVFLESHEDTAGGQSEFLRNLYRSANEAIAKAKGTP